MILLKIYDIIYIEDEKRINKNLRKEVMYMKYNFENGKEIEIPEEELEGLIKVLKITKEEAIDTWLCDNDYEVDEEEAELTKKAKENKVTNSIHKAGGTERRPRAKTVKEYPDKEEIIKVLNAALAQFGVEDLKITNKAKIIEFSYNNEDFKVDLVQKRKSKENK